MKQRAHEGKEKRGKEGREGAQMRNEKQPQLSLQCGEITVTHSLLCFLLSLALYLPQEHPGRQNA